MPVLKKARKELFAQGIAAGKPPPQAYVDAGYSHGGAAQSASRLLREKEVQERIAELKAGVADETVKRTGFTKAIASDFLLGLATITANIAKDPGNTKASRVNAAKVARDIMAEAAKLNGMYPDPPRANIIPMGGTKEPTETMVTYKFGKFENEL